MTGISHIGDCCEVMRRLIAEGVKVQMCVTSPPYFGLRDYKSDGQIWLEKTPEEYTAKLVQVFNLVRYMLHDDGVLWLNLGDTYAANRTHQVADGKHTNVGNDMPMRVPKGLKPKDLIGIPWMVAFALRADGWYLRSDIIWAKPNPMPESVLDRPTRSHEYIFLMSKREKYYYDAAAIREQRTSNEDANGSRGGAYVNNATFNNTEGGKRTAVGNKKVYKQRGHSRPHAGFNERWDQMTKEEQQENGRNKRDVWTVATESYSGAHFATFPRKLIEPCILAGSRVGDIVLDPFFGSGTTGQVAESLGRQWIGIDINPEYTALQKDRTQQQAMQL